MNSDPYILFIALVEHDAALVNIRKKILQLQHEKKDDLENLATQETIFKHAQTDAHSAKKILDGQELDIKVLKNRQRSLKNKIEAASSSKEYFLLEQELKTIAEDLDRQENKLFTLFEDYEQLEKKVAEIDFNIVILRKNTADSLTIIDQKITDLVAQETEHVDTCNKLMHQVNPEMVEKFFSMKQNISNPVVLLDKNACSACYNTVAMQDLVDIRKHKLVPCRNCYRLLYCNVS